LAIKRSILVIAVIGLFVLAAASAADPWAARELFYIVAIPVIAFVTFALSFFYQQRVISAKEREVAKLRYLVESPHTPDGAGVDDPSEPDSLNAPAELIEACRNGTCVLFAGHGISRHSTRYLVMSELLAALDMSNAARKAVRDVASTISVDAAYDTLVGEVGHSAVVEELIRLSRTWSGPPTELERMLAHIPFEDCITTSYDDSWAYVFRNRRPVIINGSPSDDYESAATPGIFSVTHALGVVSAASTLRLSWQELRSYAHTNPNFGKYIGSLFQTATVFFLGCSPSMIEGVLSAIPELAANAGTSRKHFALVSNERNLVLNALRFQSTYGINLIPYRPSAGHPEIRKFVGQLAESGSAPFAPVAPARAKPPRLRRVVLKNIGAYKSLDLAFDSNWTTILGDNGAGKSTILRAIAIALASGEPSVAPAAQKLLRNGSDEGYIELVLGRQTYHVDLKRSQGTVSIMTQQFSPLRRRGILALGFPALRGVSVATIPGFVPGAEHPTPSVSDVVPLATTNVDGRLDNLQQWLINLDFQAGGGTQWTSREQALASRIRMNFFNILAELVPYSGFSFSRVTKAPWQVMVNTRDGEVSLDQVSQGMSSTLSWVGTLLQRMYEVYGDAEFPEQQPALVLVDEIDAHLHPAWQRQIPGLLRKHFPNVMFVATTHSALIVSALADSDVRIARRNDAGDLVVEQPSELLGGLRVDQVLTSDAFDLDSGRSVEYEAKKRRLNELIALPTRTPQQMLERAKLEADLLEITSVGDDRAIRAQFARLRDLGLELADRQPDDVRGALQSARERPPASGSGSQ
jgi:energy-coupling factor transporter ATP-binding protein EcfA2